MSGDIYRDINNSVVAARGAVARGVINVRGQRGAEAADAIEALKEALEQDEIPADKRQAALELLGEIAGKASEKGSSKTILKALGANLKEVLDDIGAVSDVVAKAWPVLVTFWS